MFIRTGMLLQAAVGVALASLLAPAQAQETVKIGLIVPMTGGQASTGKQIKAAVDLYMKEHGDTVAGKKIQIILRDSASVPDNTKRLAQELIVNDKVNILAGFEITPAAMVVAPLATEAKVIELVMAAGTSIITEKSFTERFKAGGGDVTEALKVPLAAPDFAPFLQRAADAKPDAIFVFVPSGQGATFMK